MFRGSKGLHRCDRRFWSLDCFLIVDDTHKKGRVSENSSVCMMKEFQLGRSLFYCSVLCKTAYWMLPRGCVNEIILEAGTTCHLHIELAWTLFIQQAKFKFLKRWQGECVKELNDRATGEDITVLIVIVLVVLGVYMLHKSWLQLQPLFLFFF